MLYNCGEPLDSRVLVKTRAIGDDSLGRGKRFLVFCCRADVEGAAVLHCYRRNNGLAIFENGQKISLDRCRQFFKFAGFEKFGSRVNLCSIQPIQKLRCTRIPARFAVEHHCNAGNNQCNDAHPYSF